MLGLTVLGVLPLPSEDDPPLFVDSDGMESGEFAFQSLQDVLRECEPLKSECFRSMVIPYVSPLLLDPEFSLHFLDFIGELAPAVVGGFQ